jgi:hypothetical protein
MDNKGKWKSFTIGDIINWAQVYAHIGTHVELASCLRPLVSMLNTIVKNYKEI